MKSFFQQKNRGFTLVETLVAISIFTLAILAVSSVLADSIADTGYAKKKMVASYLAQEGIEYIRNMRDTFVLYNDPGNTQNGWDAFNQHLVSFACEVSKGCYFDDESLDYGSDSHPMTDLKIIACDGGCRELYYNETTGKYNYDGLGTKSGFIRKIHIEQINNETKVFSTVYWKQGSGDYNIVFSETLFNWIE